ncbi:MAG: hypothetical protein DRZ90_02180 [Spirochaetes bacterium]|nr:MAG: hypothetical protein DRZ90_02180 [Spirochaetota bacterium]
MRYKDTGEVHMDFHLATNETIEYVLSEYGQDFLAELFRRTAQNVYRDIYNGLKNGDSQKLIEHWSYYYTREKGAFIITEGANEVSFHVTECPAVRHLLANKIPVNREFYLQMELMNNAWSEDTPFNIETSVLSEGEYTMTIRRTSNDSQ